MEEREGEGRHEEELDNGGLTFGGECMEVQWTKLNLNDMNSLTIGAKTYQPNNSGW